MTTPRKKETALKIVKALATIIDGPVEKGYTGNCWFCQMWIGNYMKGNRACGPFAKGAVCISKGDCKKSCPGNRARRYLASRRSK